MSRYLILRNLCLFLGGFLFEYCLFFLLKFSVFSARKLVQSRNNGFETFECRKKWVCGNGVYSSRLKDKFDKLQKVFLSYFVFPLLWFSFLLLGDPLCTFPICQQQFVIGVNPSLQRKVQSIFEDVPKVLS